MKGFGLWGFRELGVLAQGLSVKKACVVQGSVEGFLRGLRDSGFGG